MGLRRDAERLLETLESVVAGLTAFQGSPVQMEYTATWAAGSSRSSKS